MNELTDNTIMSQHETNIRQILKDYQKSSHKYRLLMGKELALSKANCVKNKLSWKGWIESKFKDFNITRRHADNIVSWYDSVKDNPELQDKSFRDIKSLEWKRFLADTTTKSEKPIKTEHIEIEAKEPIDIPAKVIGEEPPKEVPGVELSTFITKEGERKLNATHKTLTAENKQFKDDNRDLRMDLASERRAHEHTISQQNPTTIDTFDYDKANKAMQYIDYLIETLEVNPEKCRNCIAILKRLHQEFD